MNIKRTYFLLSKAIVDCVLLAIVFVCLVSFKPDEDWQPINSDVVAKELVTINKEALKNKNYKFNVFYKSYKGHFDNKVYDQQKGVVIKNDELMYSKIDGALTIQNRDFRIIVDSLKKFIKISDPLKGAEPTFNIDEYIKTLKNCKSVKRKKIKSTIGFRFELKAERGIVIQEIYFDKDFLSKTVIYYANDHSIRENNTIKTQVVYPRMEIEINDFEKLNIVNKEIFKADNIVSLKNNKFTVKEKYKEYKFFDGRFKK